MKPKPMSDFLVNCMRSGDLDSVRHFAKHLKSIDDYVYTDKDNNLNLLQLAAGLDSEYREEVIEFLFELHADPNYPGRSEGVEDIRAIHLAAMWGYDITLKLLLLHGSDASLRDSNNWSPIDYASIFDNYVCISILLRYGSLNASPSDWAAIIDSSLEESANSSFDKFIMTSPISDHGSDRSRVSFGKASTFRIESPDCLNSTINISTDDNNNNVNNDDIIEVEEREEETSWDRIDETTLNYSIDDAILREDLRRLGYRPGPITSTTRRLYVKLLYILQRRNSKSYVPRKEKKEVLDGYSAELNSIVTGKFETKMAINLEREFLKISNSTDYHGPKQFFNYILIDPRITQNIPEQAMEASDSDSSVLQSSQGDDPRRVMQRMTRRFNPQLFMRFIKSIFYIGKGQKKRDLMHLFDASADRDSITRCKINRIREIWFEGYGVVSLHLFHNITSKEALTREALMIDAIGLDNLTNILKGTTQFKLSWNDHRRKLLGALLLHRAYNQLLNEGERQIKRQDLNKRS